METEINHTESEEIELPIVEDGDNEEIESEDSVETFDEALESAETDDDFAKLGEAARESIEEEVEEPDEADEEEIVDTEPVINLKEGFVIKDGDIELNITDEDKLRRLAQMGLNYAGKTTELAKHRSFVKYAEDNGISLEDIQILKDIKSGNKDAVAALASQSGIDVYDINSEHEYNPEPIAMQQEIDPMVDHIAEEILSNEDYTKQFQTWVRDDRMPPEVVQQIQTNPAALAAVKADMEAGIFDRAMHQAYSDVRINGMEFNAAYLRAKEVLTASVKDTPKQTVTRGDRVRASANRKSTSQSKTYGAIADMSDDDFLANFQDIISGIERPQ
jgi:hypothetical protein